MKSQRYLGVALGWGAASAAIFFTPVSASAQDEPLTPLKACQAVVDGAERLACYDKAVGEMVAANEAGELQVVDREQVQQTRRSLFGFKLPSLGIFGGDKEGATEEEKGNVLNTTIAKVGQSQRGGLLITTAEGAVWQIDEVPRRLLDPKPGQSLEIRDGALTAYFISINGQLSVKGYRIR